MKSELARPADRLHMGKRREQLRMPPKVSGGASDSVGEPLVVRDRELDFGPENFVDVSVGDDSEH